MLDHLLLAGLALASFATPARAQEPQEVARVAEALAVRHDPPPCDVLVQGLADPAGTLAAVVDQVPMPPWVGVRAARCAADLPEAEPHVARWLLDPATPGLAEAVAPVVARLPADRVRAILDVARVGPHRARFLELVEAARLLRISEEP